MALYDIVVADANAPRDGRFIAKIGNYNPNTHPATVSLREDDALKWLLEGAQPTHTVRALLSARGILLKKHLQLGVRKGAITQEDADARLDSWAGHKEEQLKQREALSTSKSLKTSGKASSTPTKK